MSDSPSPIDELIGRVVVLDVSSPFVYVGTLVGQDPVFLILENADAHDLRDTATSRELYVVESKRHGVRANRRRVMVRREVVVGISSLEDVLD